MTREFHRPIKRFAAAIALLLILLSANVHDPGRVLANPPGKNDLMYMHAGFMTAEPAKVCLWKKIPLETYFTLISRDNPLTPLAPLGGATVTISAKLGSISRQKFIYTNLVMDKLESQNMTYTARKAGHEVITVTVTWAGETVTKTLEFDVRTCKYKVHASADLTKVDGATLNLEYWQFMGTFDLSGTLVAQADGIGGTGTTNLFEDAVFLGGADVEGTCTHNPPWQGSSGMEINGDMANLEEDGNLKLTLSLESFSINATNIVCVGDGASGHAETPKMEIASFDLDFDPLSADGGSTTRSFHFPAGRGEFDMELTVSPEAGS